MKVQAQLCPFYGFFSVVVDSFFIIPPIGLLGLRVWSLLSYALLGVLSSFAIILTRTRKHGVIL